MQRTNNNGTTEFTLHIFSSHGINFESRKMNKFMLTGNAKLFQCYRQVGFFIQHLSICMYLFKIFVICKAVGILSVMPLV